MILARRYLSFILLMAFFISAMMPFFATYNFNTKEELSAVFGDKIIICTEEGFKLVDIDELNFDHQKPKEHPKYKCALCYVAAKNLKTPFNLANYDLAKKPLNFQKIKYSLFQHIHLINQKTFSKKSRAPPFSINA